MADLMQPMPILYVLWSGDGYRWHASKPCPNCTVQSMIKMGADGVCVDIPMVRMTDTDPL